MKIDERIWAWIRENTHGGTQYPLLVKRLQTVIPHDMIADVLEQISGTCPHCWDDDSGCQCWNDE